MPHITDRDTSQLMLDQGGNPHQVCACMTGEDSPFKAKTFNMVDNESISLLPTPETVYQTLLESHRVLKDGGLLEFVVKNMRFMKSFYAGLEHLGFELVSDRNHGFSISRDMFKRLRAEHGEHFAESYSNKLGATYMLLARKVDQPGIANPKDFWFERPHQDEETGEVRNPLESRSIIVPGRGGRHSSKYSGGRTYTVNSRGEVGGVCGLHPCLSEAYRD